MAVNCVFLLQGCRKTETPINMPSPKNLRESLSQKPMIFFKNPDVQRFFEKNNINLKTILIFNKADIEKIFKPEFQMEIIEESSAVQTGTLEKTFIINQYISGIPVFAGTSILRCSAEGRILYFACNFSTSAKNLKAIPVLFTPELQKKLLGDVTVRNVKNVIFDPILAGKNGEAVMAWQMETNGQRIFIDQKTEKKIYSYPLYTSIVNINKDAK